MTPGHLRSQGIQQEQASPFHPGLHLNNWAKNFPPQDEVTYTTLKGIPHMIWQLMITYNFVSKKKNWAEMFPRNPFLSYISGKTETEQQITLQITGKPEAEHDDTPEGVSPLSSPLSQARSRYDHHQLRFHYHHLHR